MLHHILALLLAAQPAATPAAPQIPSLDTLDMTDHSVVLSVDDGYHSVYENVYPLLKEYGMTITLALIGNNIGEGRPSYRPSERFLNEAEVRELMDSCHIEIASHTLSHAFLTRLDSAAAWHEISASKRLLESLFATEVITFVYPYGDMNARVRRMVRRAGYRLARAVRPGRPNFWADPYRIPEIELRNYTRLADVEEYVQRHDVTVILLHRIVPRARVYTEWRKSDFAALLGWLHRRRVKIVTLGDLYRNWWREKVTQSLLDQLAAASRQRQDWLFEQVNVDATRTLHPR